MAGRYLITGSQIGLIISMLKCGDTEQVQGQIRDIYTNQFLGNSARNIREDIEEIQVLFFPTMELALNSKKESNR